MLLSVARVQEVKVTLLKLSSVREVPLTTDSLPHPPTLGPAIKTRDVPAPLGPVLRAHRPLAGFEPLRTDRDRGACDRPHEIARRPKVSLAVANIPERGNGREFLFHPPTRNAFQAVHQLGQSDLRRVVDEQVYMVWFAIDSFSTTSKSSQTDRKISFSA